jgi:hypothetical protein
LTDLSGYAKSPLRTVTQGQTSGCVYAGRSRDRRVGIRLERRPETLRVTKTVDDIITRHRHSHNQLYIDRLVWNRQRFLKELDTGKRLAA